MTNKTCLIFCNCGAGIISDDKKEELSEAFKPLGVDIYELHDLCAFSLNEKDFLHQVDNDYDKTLIAACYPRAIKNMFEQNGVQLSNYKVFNFRETDTKEITSDLAARIEEKQENSKYEIKKSGLKVPAWYPIIDKERCTLCGQCARFCVFGVYSYNKKSLKVVNPLSCKNNCPACGRTCPASAIIFPRLPENSALSGAEPGEDKKVQGNDQKGNLFVMLNERNNARRNIFRQGAFQQAEEEKKKALEELKNSLKNPKKDA
ncbi:4Fe-4S binding protein [Draconibacterium sediminis]|mgnify:CR=1 FL=1|uniref:4Fe-4S binding protein n=1 Tax=Draconibacterium sediminis TaxID=1544798 RepID=UPI0026F074CA|nr:4Fe-4S binding protein [Draconibacterium sediminis]